MRWQKCQIAANRKFDSLQVRLAGSPACKWQYQILFVAVVLGVLCCCCSWPFLWPRNLCVCLSQVGSTRLASRLNETPIRRGTHSLAAALASVSLNARRQSCSLCPVICSRSSRKPIPFSLILSRRAAILRHCLCRKFTLDNSRPGRIVAHEVHVRHRQQVIFVFTRQVSAPAWSQRVASSSSSPIKPLASQYNRSVRASASATLNPT